MSSANLRASWHASRPRAASSGPPRLEPWAVAAIVRWVSQEAVAGGGQPEENAVTERRDGGAASARARRPGLLLSETIDPNGAMVRWMSPDVAAAGWRVRRIPTQEAVVRLGPAAYRRLLWDTVRAERPAVLLVHPPYDYLTEPLSDRIRETGCRIVAFGFDDPIWMHLSACAGDLPARLRRVETLYDLYATTSGEMAARAADAGGRRFVYLRWAASEAAFEPSPDAPAVRPAPILLVGRAYPRRVAIVRRLAVAGLPVHVHGRGWGEVPGTWPGHVRFGPPLDREAMGAQLRAASVVLTPGGWEDQSLAMVKYRLLETAFYGGFQIAERSPDLRAYFPRDEVPAWGSADELVALAREALADPEGGRRRAERARERAFAEHRWSARWLELLAALDDVGRGARLAPPPQRRAALALDQLLVQTAGEREVAGDLPAALAFYEEAGQWATGEATPDTPLGAGRCLLHQGRPEEAVERFREAVAALATAPRTSADGLPLAVPVDDAGRGLGLSGHLTPRAEAQAFLITALLAADREREACARLDALADADLLVTVASLLEIPPPSERGLFWNELLSRVLRARPRAARDLAAHHRPRWEAAIGLR